MKVIKFVSLTGLMLVSTLQNAGVIENSQIMPPPGPYRSIMNNTPPAFVPYGSQQAKTNPYPQGQRPQVSNFFPMNGAMYRPAMQPPEWLLSKQQENKDRIEKLLKKNEVLNKENKKRYEEYLKKSEALAEERDKQNRQWIENNNAQMKKNWEMMLNKFSDQHRQQIRQAENIPEWVKSQMLKQHQQQVAIMNMNPPFNNGFRQMHPRSQQRAPRQNLPGMNPAFNRPRPPVNQNIPLPMQQPWYQQQRALQPPAFNQGPPVQSGHVDPNRGSVPTSSHPASSYPVLPYNGQPYQNPYLR